MSHIFVFSLVRHYDRIIIRMCYQSWPRLSERYGYSIYVACGIDICLVRSCDMSVHALCQPRGYRIYTRIVRAGRPALLSSRVSGFQGCRIGFGYLNCIGIDVGAHGSCRGVINQHLLIPTRARGGLARCRWTMCKKTR